MHSLGETPGSPLAVAPGPLPSDQNARQNVGQQESHFPEPIPRLANIGDRPESTTTPSAVAAREEVLRAGLEAFGTRHEEPKRVSQSISHVEREADRERIFDLLP